MHRGHPFVCGWARAARGAALTRPSARIACSVGSAARPAAQVSGRISIVRSARHRSMDVSVEYEPRAADGVAQPALRQIMLYEV
jgi:hypothetical protein